MENLTERTVVPSEKKWSEQDITDATDLRGVMEAYLGAKKDRTKFSLSVAELQAIVAEKLNNIGEEERGFEFAVLAEQSENIERFTQSVELMGKAINDQSKLPDQLGRVLSESGSLRKVTELPDQLHSVLSEVVGRMERASSR